MSVKPSSFEPFKHDDFEYIRSLIQGARDRYQKKDVQAESVFTAVLIFVNAVDYVADHLLRNLQNTVYFTTYHELNASLYIEDIQKKGEPLGNLIKKLDKFQFSDKKELLKDLREFNKLRITVVHNLMRLNPIQRNNIDNDLKNLFETAESIFTRYDAVSMSIKDIWHAYLNRKEAMKNLVEGSNINNKEAVNANKDV